MDLEPSVLGSLILGYRPFWNPARRMAGVQIYMHGNGAHVDALHLLRTIKELWSASSPPLLLSPRTDALLVEMLEHAPAGAPSIEVPGAWMSDPALSKHVVHAHARGLRLVWRGALDDLPDSGTARLFDNSLLHLSSTDAVNALQAAAARGQLPNPVVRGQIYDNVASRALLTHCLDRSGALAVAGWPMEDVLHSLRFAPAQPARDVVLQLMKSIDNDQSVDGMEQILSQDPLLAYRFLSYVNSAALARRTGIDSLRRGLVLMGHDLLSRWLAEQLPYASTEPDLRPIRECMVLRARLTERIMDEGIRSDLRREVYLSGLFSQLDEVLHEPLSGILRRLPLSERVVNAIVLRTGPYAPSLEMASTLESDNAAAVTQLCEAHEMRLEYVNRALLRMISEVVVERPKTPAN